MVNEEFMSSCQQNCQDIFEELSTLDSILYAMESICANLENNSEYYLTENYKIRLCEERNRYISLISVAREAVKQIEYSNQNMEKILA